MKNKICLFDQSCGLGDILFTIKIACFYSSQGYEIIWPVEPIYRNLKNNISTSSDINFTCITDDFSFKNLFQELSNANLSNVTNINNILYVPTRRSYYSDFGKEMIKNTGSDETVMFSKYGMCNQTYNLWQNFFSINRDYEKEDKLINLLNIKKDDDIHLINKEFGTPPRWREKLQKEIETPNNLKRIEMTVIDGFDAFDWIGIYEKAKKIDTVTTSNFYIFEKIQLQCIPTIHSKNNFHRSYEENWRWMEKIASKEYNFVN